jgi:ABC-type multidrug transport system ATPase subunit
MRHLEVRALRHVYPSGHVALNDVSLTIGPGIFGLLGPNGAGKSTLMRIVATLLTPTSGSVRVGDIDTVADPMAIRAILGYLPQDFGFPAVLPVRATLSHFVALEGTLVSTERAAEVERLLALVNLKSLERVRAGDLSGGQRQRLGLAIALAGNPRLIILDEPTAGLDPAERHRLYDVLASLADECIVILSTHLVEDVRALCRFMAILDGGRIVCSGDPLAMTRALDGQIWELEQDESGRSGLAIVGEQHRGGRRVMRVRAAEPPTATARPVPPTLEDVYFSYVRSVEHDA